MNFQKILVPIAGAALVIFAHRAYGWPGVAVVAGGMVMWVLLHFTRMMTVLKRAADQPIGSVASAVMLNARLKTGMTLMHVIAMTRSLGVLQSGGGDRGGQLELYRWTDSGDSQVLCEFRGGKLAKWELVRPLQPVSCADSGPPLAP